MRQVDGHGCVWSVLDPPRTIPNRVVQRHSAEGTGEMTPWETRSMHPRYVCLGHAARIAVTELLGTPGTYNRPGMKEVMPMSTKRLGIAVEMAERFSR